MALYKDFSQSPYAIHDPSSSFCECDPGRRKLGVKVVDIFGNDTMMIIEVNVGEKKNGEDQGFKHRDHDPEAAGRGLYQPHGHCPVQGCGAHGLHHCELAAEPQYD
jgi:hypothetical protein